MSVVNRMLRDLEGNQATNPSLKMQAVPESSSFFAQKLFWLLLLIVFLSVVWFVYQHLYQPETQPIVAEKIVTQNPVETSTKPPVAHNNSSPQKTAENKVTTNEPVQRRPTEASAPLISNPLIPKSIITKQEIKVARVTVEKPIQKPLKSSSSVIEPTKAISEPKREIRTAAIKQTPSSIHRSKLKSSHYKPP